jgi:glycosyltransferase involved in cell wall biosynthesis
MKIAHLTSVHPYSDTRIFYRMCKSLRSAGHEIHLIAPRLERAPGSSEEIQGIVVHSVSPGNNRYARMTKTVADVLEIGTGINADIYHFHDPEFLRLAPDSQQRLGKPFIYDVHEDYREKMFDKHWIPGLFRGGASKVMGGLEDYAARACAGVVAATPRIANRFISHPRCIVVQNFPDLSELTLPTGVTNNKAFDFAYVGGISVLRGIQEMIAALPLSGDKTLLGVAGAWETPSLRESCQKLAGWGQVSDCGVLDRPEVAKLFASARAGLVLLHPTECYLHSYPVKLFEYMSASLPVIASNFPLWREIVEGNNCGICVDSLTIEDVARAMRWMIANPERAHEMGVNGRRAVVEKYSWEKEFVKLNEFYEKIVSD